jgi:phosphoglucan,water dikinase
LRLLTELREALAKYRGAFTGAERQRLGLADIGLEDYAFVLASELANEFERSAVSECWQDVLNALHCLVANVRLSWIEPEECIAIESELARWSESFEPTSEFQLRRLLATLERAQRLGEGYSDKVVGVFADRVNSLGTALGVPQHAIDVYCEGDIRGNVVFQLSKLVDMTRAWLRTALRLPPWETLVAGEASGRLVGVNELGKLASHSEPVIVLLGRADGDEEIPRNVAGVLLAHPIPHLSHLGVRARQARVPFASADAREQLEQFHALLDGWVKLQVGAEQLSLAHAQEDSHATARVHEATPVLLASILTGELRSLPLVAAETSNCGAKAAAAGRLLALAGESGLFRAPRGRVLPFGLMEGCMSLDPALEERYQRLQELFSRASADEQEELLGELRALLKTVPVPDHLLSELGTLFTDDNRLAVRSSANGEDLEDFAGAGLYESVIGVNREGLAVALQTVWASLWTRRAALSRKACGIAHHQVRMAVLIQEMVPPELSFIMHTADPVTGSRDQAAVELAVGLGETLASAVQPGSPYRLLCDRKGRQARLIRLASFSFALRPGPQTPARERIDYSRVPWSVDCARAEQLGVRLVDIAAFLETRFGSPQDVEGVVANDSIYLVQSRAQQGLR